MLIFDFDGVIINSLDEITVTAHNAVTGRLDTTLRALSSNVIRLFRQNRFHVQGIGDVVTLMKWCKDNDSGDPDYIMSPEAYESLRISAETPLVERTRTFFAVRKSFVHKDRERWLALNAPFPKIWNELKKIPVEKIIILTTKNREAVLQLCKFFGYELLDNNIYSGDDGVLKTENLNEIHDRFKAGPYVFIDDSLSNLKELDRHFNTPDSKFLSLILAAWGYIGPEDAEMAAALGYEIHSQEDFISYLKYRFSGSAFRVQG
jgi:FMN phosphatase YigB (HAD superfamily)